MKIFVVSFTGDSGLAHYSASLCRELGHFAQVTLVTAENFDRRLSAPSFEVASLFRRTRHLPFDLPRFIRFTMKRRPDVVLFQSILKYPLLDALVVRMFRRAGIVAALTIHDVLPHHPSLWSRWSYANYFASFDRLIVHSARSRSQVERVAPGRPILEVPHGVYDIFDTDRLTREQVANCFPGIGPEDFVFLYFGHVDERKGILELLDAAARLVTRKGAKLLVAGHVGASPETATVRKRLQVARSHGNVVVHEGYVPFERVQEYFARADAVVLPYREGSTSGILKLAMAFRKPVVASDVGDLAETVSEGFGILINHARLTEELVPAMESIMRDHEIFRDRYPALAKKYTWKEIATAYYDFLTQPHAC